VNDEWEKLMASQHERNAEEGCPKAALLATVLIVLTSWMIMMIAIRSLLAGARDRSRGYDDDNNDDNKSFTIFAKFKSPNVLYQISVHV
jgi:hypothetical protein